MVLSTPADKLPPVQAGHLTPGPRRKLLPRGIAEMFERWAAQRGSSYTKRAYRHDVLSVVEFLGIRWFEDAEKLLRASVADSSVGAMPCGAKQGT
jgi:hypothetical protein